MTVSDYCCDEDNNKPGTEEQSENNNLVLMRRGLFMKHVNGRAVTADVNQAVFFTKGSVYRISHPGQSGDRGTSFTVSQRVLNEIIRELDPSIDDHPDRPFRFVTGPCAGEVFWRHRAVVQRLENCADRPLEHLWADVTSLQLVADVIDSAFEMTGRARRARRISTEADHSEKTEAAKAFLASKMSEPIMLDDVAREVGASPFNFARIFQRKTGIPIHRYLTLLRLRASLEMLPDNSGDLTSLALDLGFSSHSHFTDLFKREFGVTPSETRASGKSDELREISKNLIARNSLDH